MVEDGLVVFLAREEVQGCRFSVRLERVVFVVVGGRLLVLVSGTSAMSATVANTCLAAEIVRPAFRKLGARDVGLEDLVDGSVV